MGVQVTGSAAAPSGTRSDEDSRRLWAAVGAAFAVSLALGLWRIGAKSVWLDEATSIQFARLPFSTWASAQIHREVNGGLYYLLLRGWLITGRTEAEVRLPSALAVALSAGALPLLGHRLIGARAAAISGLLLALAPVGLHYAQEARGYAIVLLLSVVGAIGLVRAVRITAGLEEGNPALAWGLFAAAGVVAAYAHVFALLGFGAQTVALIALPAMVRRRIVKPAAVAVAVVVALVSPLVVGLASTYSAGQQTGVAHPTLHQLGTVAVALTGHSVPAFAVVALLGLCALVSTRKSADTSPLLAVRRLGWFPTAMLLSWAALPVVALWSYAVVTSQSTFVDRYVITALPAVALLSAAGIVAAGRRWYLAAGVLVVLLVVADVRWYRGDLKENWRDASAAVLREARPGDGIVFAASYTRVPFTYYADRATARPRPISLYPDRPWRTDVVALANPTTADRATARSHVSGDRRLWLVLSNHDVDADGSEAGTASAEAAFWVPAGWTKVADHRYTGIEVQLYQAGGAPDGAGSSPTA